MEKYYGIVEKRDYPLSDGDISQHSDGIVDYDSPSAARHVFSTIGSFVTSTCGKCFHWELLDF